MDIRICEAGGNLACPRRAVAKCRNSNMWLCQNHLDYRTKAEEHMAHTMKWEVATYGLPPNYDSITVECTQCNVVIETLYEKE